MSALLWGIIFFLTLLLFFVMLLVLGLTFFFDKKRRFLHYQCFWWSDAIIRGNPLWKVDVHGLEHIDKKQTYVIVANHQSIADIIILYQTRMQFKWIAKDSLFCLPFLGWCMLLSKHIKLVRGRQASILHVYRQAVTWLENDMSIMFFPEGSRSKTGELAKFHSGAFKLAIKKGVAVLPIAIRGTANAMPKGKMILSPDARLSITVLPAIETAPFQPRDFTRLKDTARTMIEQALQQ
ncbi:MAG: 1-acyl-sn-glycerol-3-phosphate acyltransferase [Deltaproteobacteria bacterium]|nr:1-acyl-sn-glycerol-3-phosphate acyltransferase [Deltaproteobacteria bacterium]